VATTSASGFPEELSVELFRKLPYQFCFVIQNLVHILMVLAIANPLCCCTAGLVAMDQTTPAQSSHCCASEGSDHGQMPTQPEHDTENCPHQASKEFQNISASQQELKAVQLDLALLPVLAFLYESYDLNPVSVPVCGLTDVTVAQAPPPELSQMYCIYRI